MVCSWRPLKDIALGGLHKKPALHRWRLLPISEWIKPWLTPYKDVMLPLQFSIYRNDDNIVVMQQKARCGTDGIWSGLRTHTEVQNLINALCSFYCLARNVFCRCLKAINT